MAEPALRAFFRASPGDRIQFLRAAAALPFLQLGLRIASYRRLLRWLRSHRRRRPTPQDVPAILSSRRCAVDRAGRRLPWRSTCLDRSLTLWWLLQRDGVACELRVGVRHDNQLFEAHAWVEHDGRAVNDSADVGERYSPFEAPLA